MGSEKVRGSNQLRRVCNACTSHPIAIEDDMKQPASTFVFHEQEVAGVAFRAMVETGRVVLDLEPTGHGGGYEGLDPSGVESLGRK